MTVFAVETVERSSGNRSHMLKTAQDKGVKRQNRDKWGDSAGDCAANGTGVPVMGDGAAFNF